MRWTVMMQCTSGTSLILLLYVMAFAGLLKKIRETCSCWLLQKLPDIVGMDWARE